LTTGPDSNRILAVTRGKQVALGDDTNARPGSGSGQTGAGGESWGD
jgi:hypothetical protein